jgi:putative membrane protein
MMNDSLNIESFSNQTMGYGVNGIFWVLFFILIVWLISVMLNKKNTPSAHKNGKHSNNPVEILQKRYAQGRINEEEYNKRMAHLHKNSE